MLKDKIIKPTPKEREMISRLGSFAGPGGSKPCLRRTSSRVCLGVEHGDYNGTDLFGGAIGNAEEGAGFIWFMYVPDRSGRMEIASLNFPDEKAEFKLGSFEKASIVKKDKKFPWVKFPMGVDYILHKKGYKLKTGIKGVLLGKIPEGGLSRSASLTLNLLLTLIEVNDIIIDDPFEIIDLAQAVENEYVGSPCGKLDQAMILLGRQGEGVFYSPRRKMRETVKMPSAIKDMQVVIMDTGTKRSGLQGTDYQVRQEECGKITEAYRKEFGIGSLADITGEMYEKIMSEKKEGLVLKRLKYIYESNKRLPLMMEAWKRGEEKKVGEFINDDGKGLNEDYDISGPELEKMASLARQDSDVLGSRMAGGGRVGAAFAIRRDAPLASLKKIIDASYPEAYPELKYSVHSYKFVDGVARLAL